MSIQEIIASGGGALLILLTLIQIAPLKVNPWSAIAKWFGKAINADVLRELNEMKKDQKDTREKLEEHIRIDDERNTDLHRVRILQFNTELLRNERHTKETFNDIMYNIDYYERYCVDHPDYQNNRAVLAIENIKRVYKHCLEHNDFL